MILTLGDAAAWTSPEGFMIVCLCRGLSEGDLRRMVALGAHSTEELSATCGAGADCGACLSSLDRLVDDVRARSLVTSLPPRLADLVAVGA